jgi:hypothetical protein
MSKKDKKRTHNDKWKGKKKIITPSHKKLKGNEYKVNG